MIITYSSNYVIGHTSKSHTPPFPMILPKEEEISLHQQVRTHTELCCASVQEKIESQYVAEVVSRALIPISYV